MNISIVIPATDIRGDQSLADLNNLLKSIEKDQWHETVVVMDGCEWDFVVWFNERFPWVKFLWNQGKNWNFTKAANVGMREAFKAPIDGIFLVNQDCVLGSNYTLHFAANEGISTPQATDDLDLLGPKHIIRERLADSHFAFYCPFIHRRVVEKIGYLDESFKKVFSDNDYCLRALLAGLTVETTNVKVHHRGSFVDLKSPLDRSGSGCYGLEDLGLSQFQFRIKWGSDQIKSILKTKQWKDEYKCL